MRKLFLVLVSLSTIASVGVGAPALGGHGGKKNKLVKVSKNLVKDTKHLLADVKQLRAFSINVGPKKRKAIRKVRKLHRTATSFLQIAKVVTRNSNPFHGVHGKKGKKGKKGIGPHGKRILIRGYYQLEYALEDVQATFPALFRGNFGNSLGGFQSSCSLAPRPGYLNRQHLRQILKQIRKKIRRIGNLI